MELGSWGATYNGLKSVAATWIAPPELQNPSCSNGEDHSNLHYGIEEYKTGKTTGFRIFVRRLGLTLECGIPAPLCLAVHWFYPASGQSNSKAAQGRRSPKMLRNHKIQNSVLSHYLNLLSPFRLTNLLYIDN
jgi:hypothetical protein